VKSNSNVIAGGGAESRLQLRRRATLERVDVRGDRIEPQGAELRVLRRDCAGEALRPLALAVDRARLAPGGMQPRDGQPVRGSTCRTVVTLRYLGARPRLLNMELTPFRGHPILTEEGVHRVPRTGPAGAAPPPSSEHRGSGFAGPLVLPP
jgi:hypothetical protein